MPKDQQASAAEITEETLLKKHTHQGKPFKAGDKISVTADEKEWLIENKIIKG